MRISPFLSAVVPILGLFTSVDAINRRAFKDNIINPVAKKLLDSNSLQGPSFDAVKVAKANPCAGTACSSSLKFAGKAAKAFEVGTSLPGIPFRLAQSWAGNMPVNKTDPSQQLWFWLWGSEKPTDSLVIWINGGPGCSSMLGAVGENGPFIYNDNVQGPYRNPKRWTLASSVMYVDQPVGVGYSVGEPKDVNEVQSAQNFGGFLDNFFETFPEMKGKRLFFTGESYAGLYLQYMTKFEMDRGNPHNLQGVFIVDGILDPVINWQESLTTYDYATYFQSQLALNVTDMAQIKAASDNCTLTSYTKDNLHYPPKGLLPAFDNTRDQCGVLYLAWDLASAHFADPDDFNLYNIGQRAPMAQSILSDGPNYTSNYFSRDDVKKALHTGLQGPWGSCSDVYMNYTNPTDAELPELGWIIDQTNITMLTHGMFDMRLLVNGTKLNLQNTTWRGQQGFQAPPTAIFFDDQGVPTGNFQSERGLHLITIDTAGHMGPGDAPSSSLKMLRFLLGHVKELGRGHGSGGKHQRSEARPDRL